MTKIEKINELNARLDRVVDEMCGYVKIERKLYLLVENEMLKAQLTILQMKFDEWIPVEQSLPRHLQTVWLSNGKGQTALGCLIETETGYHWGQSNGIIYQEGSEIVCECESEDLDVKYWAEVPTPPR